MTHRMSLKPSKLIFSQRRPLKRPSIQVSSLNRMRRRIPRKQNKHRKAMLVIDKADMAIKNWKLYMENKSIIEQNEKLRQRALLLHQENQTLLSQLQRKFSQPSSQSHLVHHQSSNLNNSSTITSLIAISSIN